MDLALSAWSRRSPPEFTAIYLPGPDNLGHARGEDWNGSPGNHDTEIGNKVPYTHFTTYTDGQIGRITDKIAALGLHNAVVYVFTSDHGQTVTDHPLGQGPAVGDPHDLHLRWEEDKNRQVISVLESARDDLSDQTFLAKKHSDHLARSVIYSPNGGLAYIYARTPSTATNDDGHLWSTPDNEVVRDIAIELWRQSHGEPPRNLDPLNPSYSFTGALGLDPVVLVRQTGSFLDLNGQPYSDSYDIVALVGVTPVGQRFLCQLVPLDVIEQRHGDWIDFARRIHALDDRLPGAASPSGTRCGDIILVPDTRKGFNAVHEGDAYPGWHGGPSKADSRVPLAVASEALSVDGGNDDLRKIIEKSRAKDANGEFFPQQNQDTTRVIRGIFEVVK